MKNNSEMMNLSDLMKRAHEIRRSGKTMSEAMKQAWAEAKLERVENTLEWMNLEDRPRPNDFRRMERQQQLYKEKFALKRQLQAA